MSLEVHYESNNTPLIVFVNSLVGVSVTLTDNTNKSFSILTA